MYFDRFYLLVMLSGLALSITAQELAGTRAVLNAAALTYVAAAIGGVMQLLNFLSHAGLLGGQRSEG